MIYMVWPRIANERMDVMVNLCQIGRREKLASILVKQECANLFSKSTTPLMCWGRSSVNQVYARLLIGSICSLKLHASPSWELSWFRPQIGIYVHSQSVLLYCSITVHYEYQWIYYDSYVVSHTHRFILPYGQSTSQRRIQGRFHLVSSWYLIGQQRQIS